MANTVAYRPKTSEIPQNPGVYRFTDSNGKVLYVGKAKNLRSRLTSYFAPLESLHERTRRMVTSASSVQWTVVGSEFEALQLEFTWIKEFDPPFNIQFKDDKSYPYLAITLGEKIPRVLITRNKNISHARYFGPYTKTWAIRETLDLLLPVFPVRTCSEGVYKKAQRDNRPCLLGDIGRCAAPCAGRISQEEHRSLAIDLSSFMTGKNEEVIAMLRERMTEASAMQDYETAAQYRDKIQALETVASKSAVVLRDEVDCDIFGIARDELSAAVQLFIVREGRIRGVHSWNVDTELDVSDGDLIDNMLRTAYDDALTPPRAIYVPEIPEDADALKSWLSQVMHERGKLNTSARVRLKTAQRGDIAALANTVKINAQQSLVLYKSRRNADYVTRSKALSDIQTALGMADSPLRIECFDISHLGGTNIVGSMVVFEDGLPKKSDYRKFAIAQASDDTDAMNQVLARRANYLAHPNDDQESTSSFAYPPALFVVDGALPQVNAAQRALSEAGISHIPVIGIAKRLEELWLPGEEFPIILARNSDALYLIQQLRDEAHRFAITFQRQKRSKDISSVLSEIPGVGPSKIKTLLKHFGSVTQLRKATVEEISEIPHISRALAETIKLTLSQK